MHCWKGGCEGLELKILNFTRSSKKVFQVKNWMTLVLLYQFQVFRIFLEVRVLVVLKVYNGVVVELSFGMIVWRRYIC